MISDDRYRAPALDKGLDVLELLAVVDEGLTQTEIGKRLGRSPAEIFRMLDRLTKRGYITKLNGDRFAITLKLFSLGQYHAPTRRLVSFAASFMRDLAQATRQANQLVVFDRGEAIVIAQQEAPDYWGISVRVGSRVGLFDTGSGHVLLAYQSPEDREMMITTHSEYSNHTRPDAAFVDRLRQIRERGYEMMPSAQMAGVYNLAAPILGANGTCVASLGCPYIPLINTSSPTPDITQSLGLLQSTAREISRLVGGDVIDGDTSQG